MSALESQSVRNNENPQVQLLLTSPREDDPLRDQLTDIDPDVLTPRDALAAIYKLKDLL